MKTINVGGYTIKIVQDEHAESPDRWGNDDVFLVYDHRQFNVERKGFDPTEIFEHITESKEFMYEGYYVYPVYAYIHSGVALSLGKQEYPFSNTARNWDTSMKGFCLVRKEKDENHYLHEGEVGKGTKQWEPNEAQIVAEGIVETWNTYLSGEVYGYQIDDKDGEEVDACWGFYGEEHCIEDAKGIVEHRIKDDFKKRIERVKMFIRKHVPLNVREQLLINQ
jgi:hypothetical protein